MAQITLRGIDPEIEKEIRRMAGSSGKSINRVILDMIYEYKGFKRGRKMIPANSLKELAGGWSEKDASEFLESIKSCARIDKDMWR